MRTLIMVPTRGRPKQLATMLESCYATKSKDTDIVVYLNDDDPKLPDYKHSDNRGTIYIIGPRKYLAEAYNYLFEKYPNYDYYAPLNDDHVCITKNWDAKLIDIVETKGRGWGVAGAEDNLTNWNEYPHPSGMVISGNIPRTLGYLIYPEIQHIGIDCFFMYIMQAVKRLFFTKDIVIEHRHYLNGKAFLDANYRFVYSHTQFQYGMGKVSEYMQKQYFIDLYKLEQAMP